MNNFYFSFFKYDGLSIEKEFIGFNNYIRMFTDRTFLISIRNNFLFIFFTVVIQNFIGLILAFTLNKKIIGRNIYRVIIFIPVVLSPVVVGYTFGMMLNYTNGVINEFFRNIGFRILTFDWIANPDIAIYTTIFAHIWQWLGFSTIIYLAGLQNIPEEVLDAAKIDGANGFNVFIKIIFPMLASTHFSLVILNSISSVKVFDIVYVLTKGGPSHASEVLATHIFLENFNLFHTGYASALSVVLLLIALIITALQLKLYSKVKL